MILTVSKLSQQLHNHDINSVSRLSNLLNNHDFNIVSRLSEKIITIALTATAA